MRLSHALTRRLICTSSLLAMLLGAQAASAYTAPSLRLDAPRQGAQLMDNSPKFEGITTPGVEQVLIIVRDDRQMVVQSLSAFPDAKGRFAVDASLLGDGHYTISAQPFHEGALEPQAAEISRDIVIDTHIPAAFIHSHQPGERVADARPIWGQVDEPQATLTINVRDELGTLLEQLKPTLDEHGNFSIEDIAKPAGTYIIETTIEDEAQNKVTLSRHFVQPQDTTPQRHTEAAIAYAETQQLATPQAQPQPQTLAAAQAPLLAARAAHHRAAFAPRATRDEERLSAPHATSAAPTAVDAPTAPRQSTSSSQHTMNDALLIAANRWRAGPSPQGLSGPHRHII